MKLITEDIYKKLKQQGCTASKDMDEIVCYARWFDPYGSYIWYIYEHVEHDIYMCVASNGDPFCTDFGTVSLEEVESITSYGQPRIERDIHFQPCTLREAYHALRGVSS